MSRFFCVMFEDFLDLRKIQHNIFRIQGSLRVRPTLAVGTGSDRADRGWFSSCPAHPVFFENYGPKPDTVCEIQIPHDVGP